MKVAISGSSGLVGKSIYQNIKDDYDQITLLFNKNRPNCYRENHLTKKIDLLNCTQDEFLNALGNADIFIHCAWVTTPNIYLNSPENIQWMDISVKILQWIKMSNVKKFVGIGTCYEYDIKEEILSVDSNTKPHTLYGSCKLAVCTVGEQIAKKENFQFLWNRLFWIYGKGEDKSRLYSTILDGINKKKKINLSHGLQIRDYLSANDAGKIISSLIKRNQTGIFNICSGIPISIRDFARKIVNEIEPESQHLLHFGNKHLRADESLIIFGKPNFERLHLR